MDQNETGKMAKIIAFPTAKTKRSGKKSGKESQEGGQGNPKPALSRQGAARVFTLSVLVLGASVFNYIHSLQGEGQRGFASVETRSIASEGRTQRPLRHEQVEADLARKLSLASRSIASLGDKPTLEEKLRFEDLGGNYSILMAEGKINSIKYSDSSGSISPAFIENRRGFLMAYKDLFPSSFNAVGGFQRNVGPDGIQETYELIRSPAAVIARVQIALDSKERFLGLEVQVGPVNDY